MNSVFTFLNHTLDQKNGKLSFFYKLEKNSQLYTFTHEISFPADKIVWEKIPKEQLQNILHNLHLALGISYWKTFCPRVIQTPLIQLTESQAKFWNTVYTKGLGEFFYKNKIDFRNLIQFPFSETKAKKPISDIRQNRSLVFFGGGKDSIASAQLLKNNDLQFSLFMVGESEIQKQTASLVGKENIVFKSIIDPLLFELNKEPGVYNGHVPINAIWAFLGLLAAIIYDFKYIVTSNEESANYGNVEYLGQKINHQWSKSYEFENLFRDYVQANISENIFYFSLLRSLHEIKIMQVFIKYPQYFSSFSSCNRNFRIHIPLRGKNWCGECSKCVFVFILLSAFIPKEKVIEIFGKNLYDDSSLLTIVKELLGIESFKPFECVGTPQETSLALYYAYQKGGYEKTVIMKYFLKEVFPRLNIPILEKVLLPKNSHNIPADFKNILSNL